jgi:hypothetical protein
MSDLMKPNVTGGEWDMLTPAERVTRCEVYAREAERLADLAAQPGAQEQFRQVAAQWRKLCAGLRAQYPRKPLTGEER